MRNEMGMIKHWQGNYYEHILRNQLELEDLGGYFQCNPETW
jgi:hypothetical protein